VGATPCAVLLLTLGGPAIGLVLCAVCGGALLVAWLTHRRHRVVAALGALAGLVVFGGICLFGYLLLVLSVLDSGQFG
jgi:hypothetical protein